MIGLKTGEYRLKQTRNVSIEDFQILFNYVRKIPTVTSSEILQKNQNYTDSLFVYYVVALKLGDILWNGLDRTGFLSCSL